MLMIRLVEEKYQFWLLQNSEFTTSHVVSEFLVYLHIYSQLMRRLGTGVPKHLPSWVIAKLARSSSLKFYWKDLFKTGLSVVAKYNCVQVPSAAIGMKPALIGLS